MRYAINFDKLINRLVPHYLGGRKLILYLQALVKPLQYINNEFVTYANETRIEASMTSQIFQFEWFLNRKLSKYFKNGGQIILQNSIYLGTPIYYENANASSHQHVVLRHSSETSTGTASLYFQKERSGNSTVSFIVSSPVINTNKITLEQYEAMLRHYIDQYRIADKTYLIQYNK